MAEKYRTKLKICGLRRDEDIDYVNELKPDYIGFILTPGFRRSIDRQTAMRLKSRLSPDINTVGVFVDDSAENIDFFVRNGIIDTVQLHGGESAELCAEINAPVIKYFNPAAFGKIGEYKTDYYLFDSGTGTGRSFDWAKIPRTDVPFFLAGGIDKNNIREAVRAVKPYCIDLSSAVETDGYKDYSKIKEITEIMKNE